MAVYQATTNLKGVSSMKLARDIDVTQKTAWFMLHRIHEALEADDPLFPEALEADDPLFPEALEADEAYVGGLEKNKHAGKRMAAAGGTAGKAIVASVRDRGTGMVAASVVPDTSLESLVGMVQGHAEPGAQVFTDEARGYLPLRIKGYAHQAVSHSTGQYVDGMAHTNGMESIWATMNRGYHGVYHQMSHEHLDRYVDKFSYRHNERPKDTIDQMSRLVKNMDVKHLTYAALIADGTHARRRAEEMEV